MSTREDYQRGMAAYTARRYDEAAALLSRAAADSGQSWALIARYYLAKSHHRLGCRLLSDGRPAQAASHFHLAGELQGEAADLAGYLAACYLGEWGFDAACDQLARIVANHPDAREARIRLALAQCKAGEPLRAISTLKEGIVQTPGDSELHYQLGVITAAVEDTAQAQRHFERAVALDPTHARALERLAQCCSHQGRHERAVRYLEKAHRVEPGNARIAWQLTIAAPAEAAHLVSSPDLPGESWDRRALDRLAGIIIEEPEFIDAFAALPSSAADAEVFLTLSAAMRVAIERHPRYADLHYRQSVVHQRLGRSSEAIQAAQRALAINPRYVNALILLGQLYAQTDQTVDAVARLEAAIRTGGDYPDVHYLLGRLCQRIGSFDRARTAYRRALELNADYQEAWTALAALAA